MSDYSAFKLLAVDDHEDNLFTLRSLLQQHMQIQIIEATSGKQAIEIATNDKDIDLILLDIQMPELDGFQTASMLKIKKKTRDIPIIFLTAAFKSEEFQQKGYAVGAVDYLLKPIDDNQLINKVSTYFRLIEKERHLNQVLEQKVAERTQELFEAKQHLENIILHMGEALLVLSPEGVISAVNPAALSMLGYAESELLGLSISDVFEEEREEQADAFFGTWLEALIKVGALSQIEACFIARDKRRVPILFSRSAIKNESGDLTHILCIAKNMTGYIRKNQNEVIEVDQDV